MTEYNLYIDDAQESYLARGPFADLVRLPMIIKVVLLSMLLVFCWNLPFLGYNSSGLAWVIPCAFSILVILQNVSKITFPFVFWIPWVVLLLGYLALVEPDKLDPRVIPTQRTVQLLCPLFVGMAVSTWRPTNDDIRAFFATCRRLAYLILLIVGFKSGVLLTGVLPNVTGLAAEAITVTLLCAFFISSYTITGKREDLLLWGLMVCIPVIAVTRMAIAVSLFTFPLTFGPLHMSRRIVAFIIMAMIGVAVFNSERVQKKTFYSGKGEFKDFTSKNKDLSTSGRQDMWEKMGAAVDEEFLTGHGTGMGETFVYNLTGYVAYPHNDWLLTLYDKGIVGVVVYSACILLTLGHAIKRYRQIEDENIKVLLLTGAGGFVVQILMMFTDNIMVYASYFGNLHCIFLGLAYGAIQAKREDETNRYISDGYIA